MPLYEICLGLGVFSAFISVLRDQIFFRWTSSDQRSFVLSQSLGLLLGGPLAWWGLWSTLDAANKGLALWVAGPWGGSTWAGALSLSLITGFVWGHKTQISWKDWGQVWGSALLLGLGLGRIGCYLAGCCPGKLFSTTAFEAVLCLLAFGFAQKRRPNATAYLLFFGITRLSLEPLRQWPDYWPNWGGVFAPTSLLAFGWIFLALLLDFRSERSHNPRHES